MSKGDLQLSYGEGFIEFQLERRDRRTLAISVKPDLGVEVVAPIDAPMERIFDKVRKRAPWIQNQLRFFAQFQPRTPKRKYLSGETHRYLGRQYKLKLVPHIQQQVKLYRGCIVVQFLKPGNNELIRELVDEWYRERAHIKFRERLCICRQKFPNPHEYEPAGLVIRHLQRRWGSMTSSGKLILNRSLIQASVDAIDYVITHELCHIRQHHHGPEFLKVLDRVMPDWKGRKMRLERQLA
jgi:predicted metal-dependent hydrolase